MKNREKSDQETAKEMLGHTSQRSAESGRGRNFITASNAS